MKLRHLLMLTVVGLPLIMPTPATAKPALAACRQITAYRHKELVVFPKREQGAGSREQGRELGVSQLFEKRYSINSNGK
ncbi:MAG: hypothetical protein F6K58_11995 [Symploca sp. SIO2E9]|nr:hypothetical protein [Symploca sp. SIO2E9]